MNRSFDNENTKGIWFVVSQYGCDGLLRHVVAEELRDKPEVEKYSGDLALTGGETRKARGGDCINLYTKQNRKTELESIDRLVQRAMEEEMGISDPANYRWKQVGLMDVDCTKDWTTGKIGPFVVAIIHVLMDSNIKREDLRPTDPDTRIFDLVRTRNIFNGKNHRAGSFQAFQRIIGNVPCDKIIQAERYEPKNI